MKYTYIIYVNNRDGDGCEATVMSNDLLTFIFYRDSQVVTYILYVH